VGTAGHINKAEWFAELWERFGYTTGVHLRRMHYTIISQDEPVKMPSMVVRRDKSADDNYRNTDTDWEMLTQASKFARRLGLISVDAIVDRRNPAPIINDDHEGDASITYFAYLSEAVSPEPFEFEWNFQLPSWKVIKAGHSRHYFLEVWAEKSTQNDILSPLCEEAGANLVTGLGEMSITACRNLYRRIAYADRPTRIFYISDLDPKGWDMPVSVARKLEYELHEAGTDQDVRIFRTILTWDQVQEYDLPPQPVGDKKGADSWKARFGDDVVELDALEAIYPGEMKNILLDQMKPYLNLAMPATYSTFRALKDELEEALETAEFPDLEGALDELIARYQSEFDSFQASTKGILDEFEALRQKANTASDAVQIPLNTSVKPEYLSEEPEALFDSRRDYLEQIAVFKDYKAGIDHP
jgi:hypothetical protein